MCGALNICFMELWYANLMYLHTPVPIKVTEKRHLSLDIHIRQKQSIQKLFIYEINKCIWNVNVSSIASFQSTGKKEIDCKKNSERFSHFAFVFSFNILTRSFYCSFYTSINIVFKYIYCLSLNSIKNTQTVKWLKTTFSVQYFFNI